MATCQDCGEELPAVEDVLDAMNDAIADFYHVGLTTPDLLELLTLHLRAMTEPDVELGPDDHLTKN